MTKKETRFEMRDYSNAEMMCYKTLTFLDGGKLVLARELPGESWYIAQEKGETNIDLVDLVEYLMDEGYIKRDKIEFIDVEQTVIDFILDEFSYYEKM